MIHQHVNVVVGESRWVLTEILAMNAKRASESATGRFDAVNTRARAFAVLGLKPDASAERIRSAYRHLAFKHHPDRNKSESDGVLFKRITRAYHLLADSGSLGPNDANPLEGACHKCSREAELHPGLDRNRYCRDCLLTIDGRRGLPAPPIVFATFGFAVVALLGSCMTFVMFVSTDRMVLGWATLALSCSAFFSIAITAIAIGRTARPKQKKA